MVVGRTGTGTLAGRARFLEAHGRFLPKAERQSNIPIAPVSLPVLPLIMVSKAILAGYASPLLALGTAAAA